MELFLICRGIHKDNGCIVEGYRSKGYKSGRGSKECINMEGGGVGA